MDREPPELILPEILCTFMENRRGCPYSVRSLYPIAFDSFFLNVHFKPLPLIIGDSPILNGDSPLIVALPTRFLIQILGVRFPPGKPMEAVKAFFIVTLRNGDMNVTPIQGSR